MEAERERFFEWFNGPHETGWTGRKCTSSEESLAWQAWKARAQVVSAPSVSVDEGLLSALDELIEVAERCDGWESFPSPALDKARAVSQRAEASKASRSQNAECEPQSSLSPTDATQTQPSGELGKSAEQEKVCEHPHQVWNALMTGGHCRDCGQTFVEKEQS